MNKNKPKTVAFLTLGCKVNTYDSEAMAEYFKQAGYTLVDFKAFADVYVVNTCTVTHISDRKSRAMLRRARRNNPKGVVVAAGCYAQVSPETLLAMPEIDLIVGNKNRHEIVQMVEKFMTDAHKTDYTQDLMHDHFFEPLAVTHNMGKTRAVIKVQEGCNQFCTYCIIPFSRGGIRSRDIASTEKEVRALVANGYQEFVITGIHLASYGKDLEEDVALIDLLRAIDAIEGVKRIRLGSLDPRLMSASFIEESYALTHLCPHFHLSLQSGSDGVLKRMGRQYTTADYQKIVENIRAVYPNVAITTDIMVGFPGETDTEFKETLTFVKTIQFYQVHVFKYSKRSGTKAADYPDQVDEAVKNRRSAELLDVVHLYERQFLEAHIGQTLAVLYEKAVEKDLYEGHTPQYMKVLTASNKNITGKILETALQLEESNKSLEMKGLLK